MKKVIFLSAVALVALLGNPDLGFAKTGEQTEVSAWIPYWRAEAGVASILPQLDTFTEVNPFVYTVKQDGTLFLNSNLDGEPWASLRAKAKEKNIRYIPTVMWANPDAIDDVLRDPEKRLAHVRAILKEVYARGFNGVDIDYEGKYARTKDYFSLFIKDLYEAMGYDKWIMCTIEARTPLDSRFATPEDVPKDIEYANDFKELNKYCDRVRIMTYDQGRFDLKLNDAKGDPYAPVADRAWVEKVMRLTAEEIAPNKLVIGVATYGYEYDMFASLDGSGDMEYSRLWSFNPGYTTSTAAALGLTPTRNSAGELMLVFPASKSIEPTIPLPFATRIMSWSDAGAIEDKTNLANILGIRGIAVFKIDGGQDPLLWDVLAKYNAGGSPDPVAETPPVQSPSTSPVAVPTRDLAPGAVGEEVRALQKLLNTHGYAVASTGPGSPGNETTKFGTATYAALVRFQKAKAITPSVGYFGPKTRAVFQSL